MAELTENEINLNTGWKDEETVNSIVYQVYSMGAFRGAYGDEEINYGFNPGIKSITYTWVKKSGFTPVSGVTYREVTSAPTTTTAGEQDEIVVLKGNPDVYYECTNITVTPNSRTTLTLDPATELKSSDTVVATFTVSGDLETLYPNAIVSIDGKEYTLGVLDSPITFYMNRDHRVSINWVCNELVETFRIIARR
jgi:hypothetical protein